MNKPLEPGLGRAQCRVLSVCFLLIAMLLGAGCATERAVYEQEIRASRSRAFDRWQRTNERGRDSEVTLEGKLGLEDAIRLALTHNKRLQAAIEGREIARGRVVESYSEALPKVKAVGSYVRLDEVASFDIGGKTVSLGSVDNYSVDLQVRQPIFRGGAISTAMRAAKVFAYLTDEQVRGSVQATVYAVASAYYETLLAQHLYTVSEDAVSSAQMHLADVKRKRVQGVASQYDVLRAQVEVSNFRAEMIQRRNRIHLAKTRLLNTMGVSQDSSVTLSDKLTYRPIEPELDEAVRLAYENRPDIYQAELEVRLQEESLRYAKSAYWPRLDAVFSQQWSRPDPHSMMRLEWGDAWNVGLTAEWSLFDGLRREGNVIQEKAILEQRKKQLLDVEERTQLEVQQAILSLHDADEFVGSQQLNLERAKEALRLVEAGYREGINTEVEVADARAALTRAIGLYYQATYDHTIARLKFELSTGMLGPQAGSDGVSKEVSEQPGHIEESAIE